MKLKQNPKYQFLLFVVIFFLINFFQSKYTALFEDEAYYWVWAQNMAFGYFDHPPLVALWVKISSFFFDNELGVRFFSVISFTIMLIIMWKIIDVKEKQNYVWLFFLLVVSAAFLNVYGFITTPDTPLLLFVALFLYCYKKFLESNNWLFTLGLGFAMSGMLYSKYHGVLLIFFVVLSNLSLLKNKKFWIAGLFGFILFLPHLYWQYINDFPTFRYHLIERGKEPYKFGNTLLHLVNQIAIVGITFPLIYYAFFKEKAKNLFERSLKYIVIGFIVFFFFSTYKSKPQAQWTIAILIPLIVLSFRYFIKHKKARKWLLILGSIQFFILLVARIFLANENISPMKLEPHIAKTWVKELKENTDGKPVVFMNYSYRNAAVYKFYTGIKTHSYSIVRGRKSQYDLVDFEKNMQGENIVAISDLIDGPLFASKNGRKLYGSEINNYTTFQKVTCKIPIKVIELTPGKHVFVDFELKNTYSKSITFENVSFKGVFQEKRNKVLYEVPIQIDELIPLKGNEIRKMTAKFIAPEIDANKEVTFRIALQFYNLSAGFQGNKVTVKLKE